MASHRRTRTPILPAVGRRAAACAAIAPLAMLTLGGGVAMADSGDTGGQDALCHENTVCAPVNATVPVDVDLGDVAVLNHIHLLHH